MDFGPLARIALRYGIGYFAGSEAGEQLSLDPDLVLMLSLAVGAVVECFYVMAKRKGWTT